MCSIHQKSRNPLPPLRPIDIQMPNRGSAVPRLIACRDKPANSIVDQSNRREFPGPVPLIQIVQWKAFGYRRLQRSQSKSHSVAIATRGIDRVGREAGIDTYDLLRIVRQLCFPKSDHRSVTYN
jgi:hypothetical protein